jgi:tetratricopeptide (TPR) repeat protein
MKEALAGAKSFSFDTVCQTLSLRPETLRRWEQFDLVQSVDGLYDFQDIVSLQTLMQLLGQGVSLKKIRTNLHSLKETFPDIARPLAQLRIIADSQELLDFVSESRRMNSTGQIHFGFDADIPQVAPKTAEEWFEYGTGLERGRKYPEAARAYRKAIELEYEFPEALFNLGNVYRAMADAPVAERLYHQSLEQDPSLVSAWYNLGTLQIQTGKAAQAIDSLQHAIRLNPNWPDAHYNLALLLESCGYAKQAHDHWQTCLNLAPLTDIAVVAQEHLAALGEIVLADKHASNR